jgi:tripartite ATP-independent transporter DctP family solute receptor
VLLRRRDFLGYAASAAAAVGSACRGRANGKIVLRLSHSMASGPTALHSFAEAFKQRAEAATGGAVELRIFASGTLGHEREVVQQLQEGLVDFMVSGTAIWGSVAPKLQLFDFPFLWRDMEHLHAVVDGPVGSEAADYMEAAVHVRPFAWGDSFGFRHVVTRSREVTEPAQLRGLKIRTIQSPIYVKAIELMGASPTPMAFGEVYTSMQTGVIDGYEHDASTTLQQRFYEVARVMTRTRHIAGVIGLWGSTRTLDRLPADLRDVLARAAREAASHQRRVGPAEEAGAAAELRKHGMTIAEFDNTPFRQRAEQLWRSEGRTLGVTPWLEAILA